MIRTLLKLLLGADPAPWTDGGSWSLDWLALPAGDWALLGLVGLAAATWGAAWLYRREGRGLGLGVRLTLTALRVLALLGVVAMLLEPVMVFSKKEWQPANLLILTDISESMELRDAWQDQARAARLAELLKLKNGPTELRERSRLELARQLFQQKLRQPLAADGDRILRENDFTGRLLPAATAATQPDPTIDRTTTGIGAALREAIAAYRGQPLAGVLLITDGQSNTGEPPLKAAEFAGGEGVPIVVLAAGTPEGPRNARLTKLEASPVVFVRDNNQIKAIIESRGLTGASAQVVLERRKEGGSWEEAGRQPITLGETGQLQSVTFDFAEPQPARLEFRATLTGAGSELTSDDNTAVAEVRVIRQKIKVLLIAGSTFPEVQFLRNTLLRDASVDLSSWLQAADAKYEHPGASPIRRLPATQTELNDYDCIVLYDPDPAAWPQDYPQMLTDFVAQAGGGLIYIAGERMSKLLWEHQGDPTATFAGILPVVVEPGLFRSEVSVKISSREPWRLDVTSEGKIDPIFQFGGNPQQNEQILASLPGMYWHFPVTRAKPGATVLARHGDPRMRNQYGPHVLLATQLVGPGRTFFVGFDSTYRWRYLDEQYFDGFWARMIDRAGRSKQLGGRYPYTLATDRASYRPGSQVTLTARFINPADLDSGLDALHGEVEAGDQPPIALTLAPRPEEPGVFEASFPVPRPGPHLVRVWSGEPTSETGLAPRAATLQFQVELPNLEYDRPTQDRATLELLAKVSGGAVLDMDQVEQLPAAFKIRRVAHTLEDRQEIWHAPLLFGSILLLIFTEWILRKRHRLI